MLQPQLWLYTAMIQEGYNIHIDGLAVFNILNKAPAQSLYITKDGVPSIQDVITSEAVIDYTLSECADAIEKLSEKKRATFDAGIKKLRAFNEKRQWLDVVDLPTSQTHIDGHMANLTAIVADIENATTYNNSFGYACRNCAYKLYCEASLEGREQELIPDQYYIRS